MGVTSKESEELIPTGSKLPVLPTKQKLPLLSRTISKINSSQLENLHLIDSLAN